MSARHLPVSESPSSAVVNRGRPRPTVSDTGSQIFGYAPQSWPINERRENSARMSAGAALVRLHHIGARQEFPMQLPPTKGGVVPYLTVDGAVKASDFYKKAFAAE